MLLLLALCAQFALADSLFACGYYDAARIEYERGFFFHPELKHRIEARLNHALSLLAVNEIKGIAALSGLVNEFPTLPSEVIREIALQYMRCGRHYLAIALLRNTEERRMLGLAYLLDDQFIEARDILLLNGDNEIAAEIDDFLRQPQKSEKTALLLSLFLPGAGQVYAADLQAGFMDFFINLGAGCLFSNALRQQKYVDASLVFFFLINRFYIGSLNNAQKAAREYNEKARQAWRKILIDSYFGDLAPQPE
ncbi:hypothetical protein IBX73_10935 [candidate division WOR-3 bacterium]|nr:hypothetical protein [candidate division WOR-3 bacterium]